MDFQQYKCKHCEGVADIVILRETEKATLPVIEFCPFCGMSNFYLKELEKTPTLNKSTEVIN